MVLSRIIRRDAVFSVCRGSCQHPSPVNTQQGVRVDPLVKSARSSIWPMDRSGSILKGKGSKGSRTYRSVVPRAPRVGPPRPRRYHRAAVAAEPVRRALVARMEVRLLPEPAAVGEESAELPLVAQVEQRRRSTSEGVVLPSSHSPPNTSLRHHDEHHRGTDHTPLPPYADLW